MLQPFSLLPPSLLLLLATAATDAQAFSFPLPLSSSPKPRFKENALSAAGGLGLDHLDGRVAALGDWNGDQFVDVFALSGDQRTVDVWLWDHLTYAYRKSPVSLLKQHKIHNVVPMDLNHDGRLDLLVMSEAEDGTWWTETSELLLDVHFQGQDGAFESAAVSLPRSALAQPMIVDISGDMQPDLLGLASESGGKSTSLKSWRNSAGSFSLSDSPLDPSKTCKLAGPHSSAFIDLDGDCLADIFLHCEDPYTGENTYQIWLNRQGSFELTRDGRFPAGSGMVTFADMNRDGTLDMVFPVCASVSTKTGLGQDCAIHIAHNTQFPLCSPGSKEGDACRPASNLCTADPDFSFDLSKKSTTMSILPFSALVPDLQSPSLAFFDTTQTPSVPLPVRLGDFNMDGFPDLLVVVGVQHGATQARLLESIPCGSAHKECSTGRTFRAPAKGTAALDAVTDVKLASFLDVDDDGSLDILLQRTGKQSGEHITFIQNGFYNDAFFLKALVLNGVCEGTCKTESGASYEPVGVSYSGPSFKFTILDTNGKKTFSQVAQLPQTSYLSLQTPYSLFGLGRTNNYVENLFVGSTLRSEPHFTSIEGVIPNSQVVISPPAAPDSPGLSTSWKWQLYLHPADYVPWVSVFVVLTTLALGGAVALLHRREQREDEADRRRALHGLNFSAM